MKKILLSGFVIVVFAVYAIHENMEGSAEQNIVHPQNASPTQSSSNNSSNSTPITSYKDGTYTGSVADAFYGNVQVSATISNGKITDVKFLQYPNDRGTSVEINSQATPALVQEAIKAQSAQVDIVSGATQTSGAFQQSLQNALDQARS